MARIGRGFPSHPIVRGIVSTAALVALSASDSAPATDTASIAPQVSVRTASDSAPATDSASVAAQISIRTASDSAPATDSASHGPLSQARTASDAAPATDSATRATQVFTRTASDSAPATDGASRAVQVSTRTASDSAPATDAVTSVVVGKTASDSAPATDTASRAAQTSARTASDSAPATESTQVLVRKAATDSAPATDSASRAAQLFTRTATDSAPATDSATVVVHSVRTASDSAPATDSATRAVQHFTRTATDGAPATDSVSRAAQLFTRTASDAAPATETIQVLVRKYATDSAPATDSATRAVQNFTRTASDSAPATDTATKAGQLFTRSASDSAPATDRTGVLVRKSATDSAPATDSVSRATQFFARTAADAAPATDTAGVVVVGAGGTAVVANPNWPLANWEVDFSTTAGPPQAPPSSDRQSINAKFRRLTVREVQIQRGRQYELDQVQAGTCHVTIPDPLEQLNPDNGASPFNSGDDQILPYRPFWMTAVWPNQPGSGNLWNPNITATIDPSFEKGTGPFDAMVGGGTFVSSAAQHVAGTKSLLVTQASPTGSIYAQSNNYTSPGITYTASAYVYPTGGASVQISVTDATGLVHHGTTASAQNTWTRIYVAWTTADTLEQIVLSGTGSSTPTYYVDCMQLEFGANLTAFTATGPTLYPLFTGYVERWPTTYDMNGYRAIRPLQAVDALALLSLTDIKQQYVNTIAQDNPQFVLRFDDTSGPSLISGNPQGFANASNTQGGSVNYGGDSLPDGTPALALSQQIQQSTTPTSTTLTVAANYGDTSIQLAATVNVGDWLLIDTGNYSEYAQVTAIAGTAAPYTATITESPFGIVGLQLSHSSGATVTAFANQDTMVSTPHHSSYSVNFAGATFEGWMKPIQGDITAMLAGENLSGADPTGFNTSNPVSFRDTFLGIQSFYYGLQFVLNDSKNGPSNYQYQATPNPLVNYANAPDGNWHYYAIKVFQNPSNSAQYLWSVYTDYNPGIQVAVTGSQALRRVRFNEMVQLASTYTGAPQSTMSVGKVAYYPSALSDARLLAHAQAGFGYQKEITGARVLRLLQQYWGGNIQVADGFMAMANDFTYDPTIVTSNSTTGAGQSRTVLDVLQEIQETERGLIYVDRFGTIQFEDRDSRYANQTALWTFGEDPSNMGLELPYSAYETDYDPTYLFTQADLTSPTNNNFLPLVNPTGVQQFGTRVLTQQIQTYSDWDMTQAGIFYLTRYGTVRTRLTKLTLDPASNPALWPTVLGLEIGQRIKVVRRTPSGVTVTKEFYVEDIRHNINAAQSSWKVELQCSPVFVPQAWVLNDPTYGVLDTTTYPIY